MKKSFIIICAVLLTNLKLCGQTSLNNYKYVIIPTKYNMFDSVDKYELNSLTKFLFNKYGYTSFLKSDPFPEELNLNPCLALNLDLEKHSGFLNTKVQIHLYDCKQNLIMSSKIGSSRVKTYQKAYNLALRDAFTTFQNFEYEYEENKITGPVKNEIQPDIRASEKTNAVVVKPNVNETTFKISKKIKPKLQNTLLYAQPISNGYQLVDTTPKKIMVLLNTGIKNTFIVKNKDALVYQKNNDWILVTNNGEMIETKVMNIKF